MDFLGDFGQGLEAFELGLLGRLLLAALLGGAIGWDREASGKPAGLRTNILICIGAALLTEISVTVANFGAGRPAGTVGDPSRIAAQIVSGIGFLGAGTIIQARGSVTGLTTAATLWVVSAIGIAVGAHAYVEALGATLLVLVTLMPLQWLERVIEANRHSRTVRIKLGKAPGVLEQVERILNDEGLTSSCTSLARDQKEDLVATFDIRGDEDDFRGARRKLAELEGVKQLGTEG